MYENLIHLSYNEQWNFMCIDFHKKKRNLNILSVIFQLIFFSNVINAN